MRLLVQIAGLILLGSYAMTACAQVEPTSYPQSSAVSPALTPHNHAGHASPGEKPNGLSSATTVASSLALVLGIFFLIVWVFRRASPQGLAVLPPEVVEVLGRAPLANRQQAQLLRCGNKLVLVSVGTAGAEPLTEITDAAEVERLTDICRNARPQGATAAFRQALRRREDHDA